MDLPDPSSQPNGPLSEPAPADLPAVLLTGLATVVIGWLAFLISRAGVAPAVLFPIVVGLAVGGAQTAIFRSLKLSLPLRAVTALALLWGGVAVATEDYSGYRDYLARYSEAQRGNHLASVVQAATDQLHSTGFLAYTSAVIRRDPFWWSLDAVLTPLAAAVVAAMASRRKEEKARSELP